MSGNSINQPENLLGASAARSETLPPTSAALQRLACHDLPNQLVVVNSLVELLHEELHVLSDDGKEHLRRLQMAGGRVANMARLLKEMINLQRNSDGVQEVPLEALGREVETALARQFRGHRLVYHYQWDAGSVRAKLNGLRLALVELIRASLELSGATAADIFLRAQAAAAVSQIELTIVVEPGGSVPRSSIAPENRLDVLLAREILAGWDGTLEIRVNPDGIVCHSLGMPLDG